MSKRPLRASAEEGKARRRAQAQRSESSEDSSGEDAGAPARATAAAGGGAAAAAGSRRLRADSDDDDYQGDSRDYGKDSDTLEGEDDGEGQDPDYSLEVDSSDEDNDDDDDDFVLSRPGLVSEEEKKVISSIKEKLMVTQEPNFIKDLTRGLSAFIIYKKKLYPTLAHTVDLLSKVSFHQAALTETSRKLICEQTVRAMLPIDLSKIKDESHKTFSPLAQFHRTRIVAAFIGDIDTVLAGMLVLQLSLAQIAAARTNGEPLAPGAVDQQTALITHLLSLEPLAGVAQICAMVILNVQYVQRCKIKNHYYSALPPQLFDKKPIVHGVAARADKMGVFIVFVNVAFEGDFPALGGCPAVTGPHGDEYKNSGKVSALPAKNWLQGHTYFPHKQTS